MYTKPGIVCGCGLFVMFSAYSPTVTATVRYAVTDLGTLGGGQSEAYGLDDLGQIVGNSGTPSGGSRA